MPIRLVTLDSSRWILDSKFSTFSAGANDRGSVERLEVVDAALKGLKQFHSHTWAVVVSSIVKGAGCLVCPFELPCSTGDMAADDAGLMNLVPRTFDSKQDSSLSSVSFSGVNMMM